MASHDAPTEGSEAIFTFATTHQAMAAEDILREAGIELEVVPPPRELSPGCGLALKVSLEDVAKARLALREKAAVWDAIHELGPAQEVTRKLG